jgi:hypothetical protein
VNGSCLRNKALDDLTAEVLTPSGRNPRFPCAMPVGGVDVELPLKHPRAVLELDSSTCSSFKFPEPHQTIDRRGAAVVSVSREQCGHGLISIQQD